MAICALFQTYEFVFYTAKAHKFNTIEETNVLNSIIV